MSNQTNPRQIERTIEHAEASFSRMLRMIHRLHEQHEERARKLIIRERIGALEVAHHNHANEQTIRLLKQRLTEAQEPTP